MQLSILSELSLEDTSSAVIVAPSTLIAKSGDAGACNESLEQEPLL